MRPRTVAAAATLLALSSAPPAAAQIRNGDFEQNPPAVSGWGELGGVVAMPSGSQGTAHSARLSPAPGVALLGGSWRGATLWQAFNHGDPQTAVSIELDYRVGVRAAAWVEVLGPSGRLGAWLPPALLFTRVHVTVPAGGSLELAAGAVEADGGNGSLTDLCQVDSVVATKVGGTPAGAPLALQPWPPAPSGPREQAVAELLGRRSGLQRFTSPAGLVGTEGNGVHGYLLFSKPSVTWQQADATQMGTARQGLRALSFRRDLATPDDPVFASRQVDLELRLALGDVQILTTSHAANRTGPSTVVVQRKTVVTPDWTAQPPGPATAPWDFRIPFDVPWDYDGSAALLWEVDISRNSGAPYPKFVSYPLDAEDLPGSFAPASGSGVALGGGCVTPGQGTGPFTLGGTVYNHKVKLRIETGVSGAPAQATVAAHLGTADPMLTLPMLCAMVRANALLTVSLGVADGQGVINRSTFDDIPYSSALVGQSLFMQAFALDFAQPLLPVSLSNGLQLTVPADPVFPSCGYVYSFTDVPGGARSRSGPWPGGVVALLEY